MNDWKIPGEGNIAGDVGDGGDHIRLLVKPLNRHNGEELINVSLEEADRWFWTQCLTGDPVDGYKGVPGIGAKGAEKILSKAEDPWQAIVAAYDKAQLTVDDAILNARLARILRPGEYNSTTKEPILWNPPQS